MARPPRSLRAGEVGEKVTNIVRGGGAAVVSRRTRVQTQSPRRQGGINPQRPFLLHIVVACGVVACGHLPVLSAAPHRTRGRCPQLPAAVPPLALGPQTDRRRRPAPASARPPSPIPCRRRRSRATTDQARRSDSNSASSACGTRAAGRVAVAAAASSRQRRRASEGGAGGLRRFEGGLELLDVVVVIMELPLQPWTWTGVSPHAAPRGRDTHEQTSARATGASADTRAFQTPSNATPSKTPSNTKQSTRRRSRRVDRTSRFGDGRAGMRIWGGRMRSQSTNGGVRPYVQTVQTTRRARMRPRERTARERMARRAVRSTLPHLPRSTTACDDHPSSRAAARGLANSHDATGGDESLCGRAQPEPRSSTARRP